MRSMVLLALVFLASSAAAQGTSEQSAACMGDALRFCSAEVPDEQKIEACLEARKESLTPACRAEFETQPAPEPAKKGRR